MFNMYCDTIFINPLLHKLLVVLKNFFKKLLLELVHMRVVGKLLPYGGEYRIVKNNTM